MDVSLLADIGGLLLRNTPRQTCVGLATAVFRMPVSSTGCFALHHVLWKWHIFQANQATNKESWRRNII